jgi:hypothetical protein
MSSDKFSTTLPLDCKVVLLLISLKLLAEGYYVASSFELEAACASFTETVCPHTGESPCKCRLVSLFAYERNGSSVPLVFHGYAGQTEVYIDTDTDQLDLDLIRRIQAILQAESNTLLSLDD